MNTKNALFLMLLVLFASTFTLGCTSSGSSSSKMISSVYGYTVEVVSRQTNDSVDNIKLKIINTFNYTEKLKISRPSIVDRNGKRIWSNAPNPKVFEELNPGETCEYDVPFNRQINYRGSKLAMDITKYYSSGDELYIDDTCSINIPLDGLK